MFGQMNHTGSSYRNRGKRRKMTKKEREKHIHDEKISLIVIGVLFLVCVSMLGYLYYTRSNCLSYGPPYLRDDYTSYGSYIGKVEHQECLKWERVNK